MKILCDVHISFKLVNVIRELGHECIHINSVLDKWFTKDADISKFSDENDYIIISKDSDFRDSFFIKQTPKKLIKINLGNISNNELIKIFIENVNNFELVSNKYNNFIIEIDIENINYLTI
jgi:predicted nuclease of predicted toxin-antitoxin system